jgi:hypothetical protein
VKEVVITRFGLLNGGDERTQREIAKDLRISRSYVSRIHIPNSFAGISPNNVECFYDCINLQEIYMPSPLLGSGGLASWRLNL